MVGDFDEFACVTGGRGVGPWKSGNGDRRGEGFHATVAIPNHGHPVGSGFGEDQP